MDSVTFAIAFQRGSTAIDRAAAGYERPGKIGSIGGYQAQDKGAREEGSAGW
jgi:hypothetical protein